MQFDFANNLCGFVLETGCHKDYMDKISKAEQELQEFDSQMTSANTSQQKKKARKGKQHLISTETDKSSTIDGNESAASTAQKKPAHDD